MSSKNNYQCNDVYAVIVTFNPNISALTELLVALMPQVGGAVIVDNGSTDDITDWFDSIDYTNLSLLNLGKNFGIAHAQNMGIQALAGLSIKFILLSDQDSKPADNMVSELKNAANKLINLGEPVAAVGPYYEDIRQNNAPPFFRIEGLSVKRQYASPQNNIVKVDYLIASGSLIPIDVFDKVGLMNKEMFIDYVDTEWGLRAKKCGYQSFGVFSAKMEHSLGDKYVRFMGREIALHSPLRHYYFVRNGVWLYKQKNLPFNWKLVDGYRMIIRIVLYIIFSKPRREHFFMIVRGFVHGMRSRMGQY